MFNLVIVQFRKDFGDFKKFDIAVLNFKFAKKLEEKGIVEIIDYE